MDNGDIQVSIVIPTYNERDNIRELFLGIENTLDGKWTYEIIIVDDNSPDDTAGAVARLGDGDPRVCLINRPGKLGLGSAIVAGFSVAKGEYWVMMDADLSHRPVELPRLLRALGDSDIAIGSRYIKGGAISGWPIYRKIASRVASTFARWILRLDVKDASSGFVAFRRETVAPILNSLEPKGFKLLLEILVRSHNKHVVEVPIKFVERVRGRSKFSGREIFAFLSLCLRLRRI
ncbi:MAG: polyprenol monophosphomannose synthase [Chloroflexi bacterium]|nr:polyprenol monophosphomannose synthase [Chloroflexota bacterium]